MRVEDAMTTNVKTVTPSTPLRDVAAILAEHNISGLPVVDEHNHVVGVVSEGDILQKERGSAPEPGRFAALLHRRDTALEAKLAARTAGEAMTAPPLTIEPHRPISSAAAMMAGHNINRLPVVRHGELVGILTRADLVRAFTRSDTELEREIREDVLLGTFWLAPETLTLHVHEGEVSIGGQVETKQEAELIPAFVRRVPGVVDVTANLTWRVERADYDRRRA